MPAPPVFRPNLASLLPLFLTLLLQLQHARLASAAEPLLRPRSIVTHFSVADPTTDKLLFRLRPNADLSLPHPIALIAHTAPNRRVASVTFVHPFRHVERFPPYALPGDDPRGDLHALVLLPGRHVVTAFADGDQPGVNHSITFTLRRPRFPAVGPLPGVTDGVSEAPAQGTSPSHDDAAADPTASVSVASPHVPSIPPSCKLNRPAFSAFSVAQSEQPPFRASLNFAVRWCPTTAVPPADNILRVRVLSYSQSTAPDGRLRARTVVLSARLVNYLQFEQKVGARAPCQSTSVYVEVCGMRPDAGVGRTTVRPSSAANSSSDSSAVQTPGTIVCATSQLRVLQARPASPPVPLRRPPPVLRLAPGDVPRFRYDLDPASVATPLRLSIAARASDGYFLGAGAWFENATSATAVFPFRSVGNDAGVSTPAHNGAVVYLRFARMDCPTVVRTLLARLNTTLVVEEDAATRLAPQDDGPPAVDELVFPPTRRGGTAVLRATARNDGNGLRGDGRPTQLTYQWLLRTTGFGRRATFARPLDGATEAALRLDDVQCEEGGCGADGCDGLQRYSVRVCNTFACVRSNAVRPNVTAPRLGEGQRWNAALCRVETR